MVSDIDTETGVIKGSVFSSRLFQLEQIALWMLVVAGKQMRLQRGFAILKTPCNENGTFKTFTLQVEDLLISPTTKNKRLLTN